MGSKMVTARHVFQSRMGSMLAWPFATFLTKIQSVGRGIAVVPLALAAVVWVFTLVIGVVGSESRKLC